jgi:hypothetical protein
MTNSLRFYWIGDIPNPGHATQRVVYCGVTSPYPSPTHPTEGDDSSGGGRNCNAPRSYTRRGRDIDRIGIGAVTTGQPDDAIARYGQDKGHA